MSMAYTIKRYVGFVSLVLVFVFILSTEAQAELYPFEPISNNSGASGQMADQLSLEVEYYDTIDIGGVDHDQVLFTFKNNIAPYAVPDADVLDGSITDVYFEDGALYELAEVHDAVYNPSDYPGVYFEQLATPRDLPGGNDWYPPFHVTADFSADSTRPIAENGVEPDETLGILFTLQDGKTLADVIDAINVGFDPDNYDSGSGTWNPDHLRISLRIQSYGDGDEFSDGFIMTPEPASLLLGSIGIGMVIARCRKRKTLIES